MALISNGNVVLSRRSFDILNYFGRCPACGYSAEATVTVTTYSDGSSETQLVGRCGLPCGWTGPIEMTTMTTVNR
ncbi:hypothetical protein B7C42_06679 [Nocardia cerradoensis]|uniref:Uncharacterized protein n=1 Tax=Nocardia cerradoensis TaxID=85688 RepID=A0A231GXN5_9NOCA|nr:hypothetical protein [Nocardia cerradoensis]OXR41281.1 hypothetical protein B7C42_06679 [Nocardia cerradoensis]